MRRLTVSITMCRMGRATWRQVHRWAPVVKWSCVAHVRRDGWTWPQRSTDTWTEQLRREILMT